MCRHKAGRREVCCGGWTGAEPLLRSRPRPFAGAKAQRLARRSEQGTGRAREAEEEDKGARRRGAGRHRGPEPGGRGEPALQHPHKGHRAGAQATRARGVSRTVGGTGASATGKEGGVNKKSGLHRHYDRLDADERFRLDVLATAREDWRESERLLASCLRSSYVMNDMGFVGRWHGAIDITLRVYIPLGELLAKLQLIDAFRVFVPYSQTLLSNMAFDAYHKGHESGSRHAWAYAGKSG